MAQNRIGSLLESNLNLAASYPLTYVMYAFVLPYFGYKFTKGNALFLTVVFSLVSLIRQYAIRRCFEYLQDRKKGDLSQNGVQR